MEQLSEGRRESGGVKLYEGGSPTALTPEKAEVIIEALKDGMPYSVCAAKVGVHPDTLRVWLRKGEANEHLHYHEFFMACAAALAEWEATELGNIRSAAHGRNGHKHKSWQASAWGLERDKRMKGKYGRTDTQNVENNVTGTVEFRLTVQEDRLELTSEQLSEVRLARENRRRSIAAPVDAEFEIEE